MNYRLSNENKCRNCVEDIANKKLKTVNSPVTIMMMILSATQKAAKVCLYFILTYVLSSLTFHMNFFDCLSPNFDVMMLSEIGYTAGHSQSFCSYLPDYASDFVSLPPPRPPTVGVLPFFYS